MIQMIFTVASFLTSFVLCFLAIPSIIKVAEIKHLFDEPDVRKSHISRTPTLGGIAIFAGLIFSLTFWSTQKEIVELQYIISAVIILFFIGIKDDLFNLVAHKKLLAQLTSAFILVHFAGIRITTFYGLFGVNDLSMISSYVLSIFTIIVITNSFNLIDGINCLAGGVGVICSVVFGAWFAFVSSYQYSILAFSLAGSLLAFLWYNRTPAKIFMGDTGSLIVGVVLSILSIKFIEMNRVMPIDADYKVLAVPVVTIGILIVPLFDTLRVFMIRIFQGRSPLSADRNHLHHLLLDLGFSHMASSTILCVGNIAFIYFVFSMQWLRGELLLILLCLLCLGLSLFLKMIRPTRRNKLSRFLISIIIPKK